MAMSRSHRFQFVSAGSPHACSACGWPQRLDTPPECPGVPTP